MLQARKRESTLYIDLLHYKKATVAQLPMIQFLSLQKQLYMFASPIQQLNNVH